MLILLTQVSVFLRAVAARMTGRLPSGSALHDFGDGPTDAITWYVRHYLLGFVGALVIAWLLAQPFLPDDWQVLITTSAVVIFALLAGGAGAFWGSAVCVLHYAEFDVTLQQNGA